MALKRIGASSSSLSAMHIGETEILALPVRNRAAERMHWPNGLRRATPEGENAAE